jgi:menaquinone-dependent protoporphyrinogen oxidase
MPRLLILYGTTDGHTAKIADFLAGALRSLGGFVDVVDAGAASPDPRGYDGVIVAASLHARGYQRSVSRWVGAHHPALRERPSIFVSVCLSVLQKEPEVQRDLAAIVRHFEAATGWHPRQVKHVAGALLYTRYGWLKRIVMRRISRKAGGETDVSRDFEYTDWTDLRAFAADLYSTIEAARSEATAGAPPATRVPVAWPG